MRTILPTAVLALALPAVPAAADPGNIILVNGTGAHLTSVTARRTGTDDWRPLAYAASPGGRAAVQFSGPDCAYDIRGSVGGLPVVWSGVNLCEVKQVTLNRNASGAAWADYD